MLADLVMGLLFAWPYLTAAVWLLLAIEHRVLRAASPEERDRG